jgi:hypothetical protein
MRITGLGNVGLGTFAPESKFHIRGIGDLTQTFENADNVSFAGNTIAQMNFKDPQSVDPQAIIRVEREFDSGGAFDLPTAITFSTIKQGNDASGLTERMRINNSGFVGIGTNAPENLLHVSGGGIILQDGNQANGRVLTSDANGNATWQAPAANLNIYNFNGTLTSARTVTQNANTLAFTGTAVNAFSVDSPTFSVDACK